MIKQVLKERREAEIKRIERCDDEKIVSKCFFILFYIFTIVIAGRIGGHWRIGMAAGDRTEWPVPNAQSVAHILTQLLHDRVDRLLDAGVDAIRQSVHPVVSIRDALRSCTSRRTFVKTTPLK